MSLEKLGMSALKKGYGAFSFAARHPGGMAGLGAIGGGLYGGTVGRAPGESWYKGAWSGAWQGALAGGALGYGSNALAPSVRAGVRAFKNGGATKAYGSHPARAGVGMGWDRLQYAFNAAGQNLYSRALVRAERAGRYFGQKGV